MSHSTRRFWRSLVVTAASTLLLVSGIAASQTSAVTATTQDNAAMQEQKARALQVYAEGTLTAGGTAVDGLSLQADNTVTTGTLNLNYEGTALESEIREGTRYAVRLPDELKDLVKSPNFKQYVTGHYQAVDANGQVITRDYTAEQMHILDNGTVLAFDNPETIPLRRATFNVDITLDLGQAVTDSGIRIKNAQITPYAFVSGIVSSEGDLDWSLISSYTEEARLLTYKLDPGYDLLQVKPTIEEPVYSSDTEITGTGTPGAAVEVTANDSVIGTGTVNNSGIYHVQISRQDVDTIIAVTQDTGVGKSEATTTTVREGILAPFVNRFYEGDTVISGTGSTPNNTIIVTDAAGAEVTRGKLDANMGFDIPITKQKAFDILYVYETDGTEQSPKTAVVVRPA